MSTDYSMCESVVAENRDRGRCHERAVCIYLERGSGAYDTPDDPTYACLRNEILYEDWDVRQAYSRRHEDNAPPGAVDI